MLPWVDAVNEFTNIAVYEVLNSLDNDNAKDPAPRLIAAQERKLAALQTRLRKKLGRDVAALARTEKRTLPPNIKETDVATMLDAITFLVTLTGNDNKVLVYHSKKAVDQYAKKMHQSYKLALVRRKNAIELYSADEMGVVEHAILSASPTR